jgi:O-antigen/teichoic acid export membrane protein
LNLFSTAFFSALTTCVRIGTGFISGKVISVILGPSGVALAGAFTNFISIIYTFSNGGITNGIIKHTSEYQNNYTKLNRFLSTAFVFTICFSLICGISLFFASKFLSVFIFKNEIYVLPIKMLGIFLGFFALNNLLVSTINGTGKIKILTIVNVCSSFFGLLLSVSLVYFFNLIGALISLAVSQSLIFFLTFIVYFREKENKISNFLLGLDKNASKRLLKFSLMSLVTAVCVPVSQIIIRNQIVSHTDLNSAGFWQAVNRVSEGMLMVVTTAMATYFLPKFSSLKTAKDIKFEILSGAKYILPIVLLLSALVFLFRINILKILFSDQFTRAAPLFLGQLIGDIIKISNWILGYLMLSKAMVKVFIITEISFSISLVIITSILLNYIGLNGVTWAYAINNLISFFTLIFIFRRTLFY